MVSVSPIKKGVNEGGGRPTTYVVSFPRVLKAVKCLVPDCLPVAHSTVQLRDFFNVPTLSVTGGGGTGGGRDADLLLFVSNAHARGAAHQTLADS